MSDYLFFLRSQATVGVRALEFEGDLIVDRFSQLVEFIEGRCGREVSRMFAEPRITRGNGVAPMRIDWYCDHEGAVKQLHELDPGSLNAVRRKLESRLTALSGLLSDRQFGLLIGCALHVPGPDSIVSVGGEPVITQWGTLPPGAVEDKSTRDNLFRSSIGEILPSLAVPAVTLSAWSQDFGVQHSAAAVTSATGGAIPPHVAVVVAVAPNTRIPLICSGVAGLMALLLYLPGFLVFPTAGLGKTNEMLRGVADALAKRTAELGAMLAEDCNRLRAQVGQLIPREAGDIQVQVPPSASAQVRPANPPDAAPGNTPVPTPVPEPRSEPIVPPVVTTPPPSGTTDLATRADRGVVLVLTGSGSGSGFFIDPETVITNRHVVEGANGQVHIASKYTGVVRARVMAVGRGNGGEDDLAILKVSSQSGVAPFVLSSQSKQLQQVMASGFPGITNKQDPAIQGLMRGDQSGLPRIMPNATPGSVTNSYQQDGGTSILVHTALIAPGNSGGPLLDQCGRVLGVNTFGITDRKMPVTFFFALAADGVKSFVERNGLSVRVDDSACEAQTAALLPVPQPPAASAPASPPAAPASPAGRR